MGPIFKTEKKTILIILSLKFTKSQFINLNIMNPNLSDETENGLENAFYWYQKTAENEDQFSQYKLAHLYRKGEGTEKNLEKAFYWFNKAVENGYDFAQNNLGYS